MICCDLLFPTVVDDVDVVGEVVVGCDVVDGAVTGAAVVVDFVVV
jgi:hypothetical protein